MRLADLFADIARQGDWVESALCAQVGWEPFYPEKGESTKEAKKVCAACPVREECLDYALERGERFGVFGGMSERQRRREYQRRYGQPMNNLTVQRCVV